MFLGIGLIVQCKCNSIKTLTLTYPKSLHWIQTFPFATLLIKTNLVFSAGSMSRMILCYKRTDKYISFSSSNISM